MAPIPWPFSDITLALRFVGGPMDGLCEELTLRGQGNGKLITVEFDSVNDSQVITHKYTSKEPYLRSKDTYTLYYDGWTEQVRVR